jgi:hypothetical protein
MPDLNALEREAAAKRDARLMAFVSLRKTDYNAYDLADKAVALDPGLTWVYYVFAAHDRLNPRAAAWIARLRAWDPDNMVPALLLADRFLPRSSLKAEDLDRPELHEAAHAILAATRYDSYAGRHRALDREILDRIGNRQFAADVETITRHSPPNTWILSALVDHFLLHSQSVGWLAPLPAARPEDTADYQLAVAVGERVLAGAGSDYERTTASRVIMLAARQLEAVAPSDPSVATQLRRAATRMQTLGDTVMKGRSANRAYASRAVVLSLGAAGVVLAGLTIGAALVLGAWKPLRRRLRPWRAVIPAAMLMLVSSGALYFAYAPFARAQQAFRDAPALDAEATRQLLAAWLSLYRVSYYLLSAFDWFQGRSFWGVLLPLVVVACLLYVLLRLWLWPATQPAQGGSDVPTNN